jgi:hypothetical protein
MVHMHEIFAEATQFVLELGAFVLLVIAIWRIHRKRMSTTIPFLVNQV